MRGSNQWVMGSDVSNVDAYIENDEGNAIVTIKRLTNPGASFVRPATDEQWQSIVDVIAAAPEMVAVLKGAMLVEYTDRTEVHEFLDKVKAVLAKAEPVRKTKVKVTVEVEVHGDGGDQGVVEYAASQVYTSPAVEFVAKTARLATHG